MLAFNVFANLHNLIFRSSARDAHPHFVLEVQVREKPPRDPQTERFILNCWLLIAVKHGAIIYACAHWPVPFHQLWINVPTFALGFLATAIYYWRHR